MHLAVEFVDFSELAGLPEIDASDLTAGIYWRNGKRV